MVHSNWNCPQCHRQNISGDLIKCPSCGKKRNRWGYWDCRYCGTKEIRADHKECPSCGKPKDRDVKFYLNDDSPYEFVDEVSGEDAVRIGHQNWICPYCSQQNDDSVQICTYCGASRTESQERYHDIPAPEAAPQKTNSQNKNLTKKESYILAAIMIFLVFVLPATIGAIRSASNSKLRTEDLIEAHWETDIYIEAYKTFTDSDWELPEDARLLRTSEEDYTYVDHYEERTREVWVDEPDDDWDDDWDNDWDDGGWDDDWDDGGWDDYGDGQFGMLHLPVLMIGPKPQLAAFYWDTEYYQEPVYGFTKRTKYYYEYDAWTDDRTVRETGRGNEHPYYAELSLSDKEREKKREIKYFIKFSYKDNLHLVQCTEEQYYYYLSENKVYFTAQKKSGGYDIYLSRKN